MDIKATGTLLKSLRVSKGLTQQQVADALFISHKTISKWENGDGLPDVTMLSSVADFYGITIDDILRGRIKDEQQMPIKIRPMGMHKRKLISRLDTFIYVGLLIEAIGLIVGAILLYFSIYIIAYAVTIIIVLIGLAVAFVGYQKFKHAFDFEENSDLIDMHNSIKPIAKRHIFNYCATNVSIAFLITMFLTKEGYSFLEGFGIFLAEASLLIFILLKIKVIINASGTKKTSIIRQTLTVSSWVLSSLIVLIGYTIFFEVLENYPPFRVQYQYNMLELWVDAGKFGLLSALGVLWIIGGIFIHKILIKKHMTYLVPVLALISIGIAMYIPHDIFYVLDASSISIESTIHFYLYAPLLFLANVLLLLTYKKTKIRIE